MHQVNLYFLDLYFLIYTNFGRISENNQKEGSCDGAAIPTWKINILYTLFYHSNLPMIH